MHNHEVDVLVNARHERRVRRLRGLRSGNSPSDFLSVTFSDFTPFINGVVIGACRFVEHARATLAGQTETKKHSPNLEQHVCALDARPAGVVDAAGHASQIFSPTSISCGSICRRLRGLEYFQRRRHYFGPDAVAHSNGDRYRLH